jgi:uncharacterized protein (TIGR03083 family)
MRIVFVVVGGFDADDQELLDALLQTWASLDLALTWLSDTQWSEPTLLPGWSVQDVVSHLNGFESQWFLGRHCEVDLPKPWPSHVHNDIAADNERWVLERRNWMPLRLLTEFREVVEARTKQLNAARFYPQGFDTLVTTFRGDETMRAALETRLVDIACHEQDIRQAINKPGNLDSLGITFVREQMISSLGWVASKQAMLPEGSIVAISLFGDHQETIIIKVSGGRGRLVDAADGNIPTAAATMHGEVFLGVTTGRIDPTAAIADSRIKLRGDPALAAPFAKALRILSI